LSLVLLSTLAIDSEGAAALTFVLEVELLFALAGSKVLELTVAVLLIALPAADTATSATSVNTSLAPLASEARLQVTAPLAPTAGVVQLQPAGALSETKPRLAGRLSVQLAAAAVHRGDLGRLTFATWRFGGEGGNGGHPYRNLIETQCHGFDMLEYLCGPIDSVMAQATDDEGQGRSTMSIALHFSNGAVGSLIGSYDSSYAYPRTHTLELNGTNGRVLIDDVLMRGRGAGNGTTVAENVLSREQHQRRRERVDVHEHLEVRPVLQRAVGRRS